MNCEFQLLYYGDNGYIGRCKSCGYYQVAVISTLFTLNQTDFNALIKMVRYKYEEADWTCQEYCKSIIIPTHSPGISLFLSRSEARQFLESLEAADSEAQALSLLSMFNT